MLVILWINFATILFFMLEPVRVIRVKRCHRVIMVRLMDRITIRFQLMMMTTTTLFRKRCHRSNLRNELQGLRRKTVEKDVEKNDSGLWIRKEEIALCKAWCDTSENSITGNNQHAKGFWDKVIDYFEKEVGANRTYNSIVTK